MYVCHFNPRFTLGWAKQKIFEKEKKTKDDNLFVIVHKLSRFSYVKLKSIKALQMKQKKTQNYASNKKAKDFYQLIGNFELFKKQFFKSKKLFSPFQNTYWVAPLFWIKYLPCKVLFQFSHFFMIFIHLHALHYNTISARTFSQN